jgi:hypothetical protein
VGFFKVHAGTLVERIGKLYEIFDFEKREVSLTLIFMAIYYALE